MQNETESRLPPAPAGAVEILRANGHAVSFRKNQYGSFRYSVDGKPETDALTMFKRFSKYGI